MADIRSLADTIRALDSSSRDASRSITELANDLQQVQQLKGLTDLVSPEEFAKLSDIEDRIKSITELIAKRGKVSEDAYKKATKGLEDERKSLEATLSGTKSLVKIISDLTRGYVNLTGAMQVAGEAKKSFISGDIGEAIQRLTSVGTPAIRILGLALGTAVSAATRAQDQIQLLNKTIIEASAATGRFSQGMSLANKQTLDMNVGITNFGLMVGLESREVQGLVRSLGQAGYSLEEMGIDEQTGKIKTFGESLGDASGKFGMLSSAIAMARATGMDMGTVIEQMRFQMKEMGDTSADTVKTFGALASAASRSGLSTSILLPLVRNMQDQFKFLGLQSDKATLSMGMYAQAARQAGLGPAVGAQLLTRMMGGLMQASFGTQAFLGQRAGMGGGLQAGFAFREGLGGRGGDLARGVVQAAQQLMGGRRVSLREAQTDPQAAALRLGQEQLVAQFTGVSQIEARAILNMEDELQKLEAAGQGSSRKAEEIKKNLKDAAEGEPGWRRKTLTAQEKIARYMEALNAIVGRLALTFVRSLAGGALGKEGTKSFDNFFEALKKGEGIDEAMDGMMSTIDAAEPKIRGWVGEVGGWTGKVVSFWKEILIGVGGVKLIGWSRSLGELGKAAGTAASTVADTAKAAGEAGSKLSESVAGAAGKTGFFSTQVGILGKSLSVVGGVVGAAAIGASIGLAIRDSDLFGILDKPIGKYIDDWVAGLTTSIRAVEAMAAAHNKEAIETYKRIGKLGETSGFIGGQGGEQAKAFLEKFGFEQLAKERGPIAAQAALEQVRELIALQIRVQREDQERAKKTMTHGQEGYGLSSSKGWGGNALALIPGVAIYNALSGPSQKGRDKAAQEASNAEVTANTMESTLKILEAQAKRYMSAGQTPTATGTLVTPSRDAWDITRAGFLYASPGDIVVDAKSIATYLKSGSPGESLRVNKGGDVHSAFDAMVGMRTGATPMAPTRGGQTAQEHEVVFKVKVTSELGDIIDERIIYNVERDIIVAGKTGESRFSKGGSNKTF